MKIVAIKASMNRCLPSKLKDAFPNTIPVERPFVLDSPIPNPHWLAGFTSGEGCFFIVIRKSTDTKLGAAVQLKFILVQHIRDEQLMKSMIEYFECGNLLKKRDTVHFTVTKFSDLTDKIIPFFIKYPVLGVKSEDLTDFCKAANLIKNNSHLTAEGLDQIRKIKAGMNKGRK